MVSAPSIADKLRSIRRQLGFSQEELARQLGVSFPTVNSWERGKSSPYPRHRKAIEDFYQEVRRKTGRQLVLVVEDDESAGLVLEEYAHLALPEWDVVRVDNGYDAILQIGLLKPFVVLLDIMMPDIDGLEVFRRVRAMESLAETRIIFVTAATEESLLVRAREAEPFALIHKPLERGVIVETLQAAAGVADD